MRISGDTLSKKKITLQILEEINSQIQRYLRVQLATSALLRVVTWLAKHNKVIFGTIYLVGLVPIGALLIYEHRLVRPDDLTRVNAAFFQVNGVISFGLLLLVLVQLAVG